MCASLCSSVQSAHSQLRSSACRPPGDVLTVWRSLPSWVWGTSSTAAEPQYISILEEHLHVTIKTTSAFTFTLQRSFLSSFDLITNILCTNNLFSVIIYFSFLSFWLFRVFVSFVSFFQEFPWLIICLNIWVNPMQVQRCNYKNHLKWDNRWAYGFSSVPPSTAPHMFVGFVCLYSASSWSVVLTASQRAEGWSRVDLCCSCVFQLNISISVS